MAANDYEQRCPWWRRLLPGPTLTWSALVGVAGIGGAVLVGFHTSHEPSPYQWTGYVCGLVVATGTLLYTAAGAPRVGTLRARRERPRASWSTRLLVLLGIATAVSSLELWDWQGSFLKPPGLSVALFALLVIALLMTAASVASKRVFRLTALATLVLATLGLGALGTQEREEQARAAVEEQQAAVDEAHADLATRIEERLASTPQPERLVQLREAFADTSSSLGHRAPNGSEDAGGAFEQQRRLVQALVAVQRSVLHVLFGAPDREDGAGPIEQQRRLAQGLVGVQRHAVEFARLDDLAAQTALDELEATPLPEDPTEEQRIERANALTTATATKAQTDAALTQALDNLGAAREARDELPTPPVEVRIDELVRDGADRAARWVTPDGVRGELHPALSVAGFTVLGLLLLVGYRQLELRNNRRYGTPIEVAPLLGLGDKHTKEALTQRLRERIFEVGFDEPGPIPGSTGGTELSSLLSEAEGLPHNKLASAIVSFLQAVAFPPAGVKVSTAISQRGPGRYEASVEVATRVAQQHVTSTIVTSATTVELIDRVANVVATNAINYSRATPPWARWQDPTGHALGLFRRAQARGSAPGTTAREELEQALQASPATAPVRLALAHQHDMGRGARTPDGASDRLQALLLHLQTATDYPTLLDGRYRLGTSLFMLAEADDLSSQFASNQGRLVVELLRRRYGAYAVRVCSGGTGSGDLGTFLHTSPRTCLRALAVQELTGVVGAVRLPRLLWHALVPSERTVWLSLLRDHEELKRRRATYRTARLSAQIRSEEPTNKPARWTSNWWLSLLGLERRRARCAALLSAQAGSEEPTDRRTKLTSEQVQETDKRVRRELRRVAAWSSSSSPAAHYNAACIYSYLVARSAPKDEQDPLDRGLCHLEEALRRGGPALFDRAWLMADPDLEPLRTDARFTVIVELFTEDEDAQRPY